MFRHLGRVLRPGITVPVLVLAALGSVAAISGASASATRAQGGPKAPSACGPAHASTLAASPTARVYSVGGIAYGCANGHRGRYRLGKHSRCSVDPVTVTGGLAAYGLEKCGTDNCASKVLVRRLSDGKVMGDFQAFKGPAGTGVSATSVESLALKLDGAVAWIASGCSIDAPPADLQVRRARNHGQTLLDHGKATAIDGHSLRLHGARLTWRHGRTTRTANLA